MKTLAKEHCDMLNEADSAYRADPNEATRKHYIGVLEQLKRFMTFRSYERAMKDVAS